MSIEVCILGISIYATVTTAKGAVQTVAKLTANGIETMTITVADAGADSSTTSTLAGDGGIKITDFNADKLTKLTIVSDTLVDLNDNVDNLSTYVNTVDASAANGGVYIDLTTAADAGQTTAASKFLSVTTGSGEDQVTNFNGAVLTSTINLGAGKDTFTMAGNMGAALNDGVETLTLDAGSGNDTIDLSADASVAAVATKTITLGDGVDTLKINGLATQTGITVTDFVAGAGGDKIDLATNNAQMATNDPTTAFQTSTTIADTTAIIVVGTNVAAGAAAGAADVAAVLTVGTFDDGGSTSDKIYVVYDDGANSYLALLASNGGNDGFTGDTLTVLVTLTGVSDATKITVDNFTDFLA